MVSMASSDSPDPSEFSDLDVSIREQVQEAVARYLLALGHAYIIILRCFH